MELSEYKVGHRVNYYQETMNPDDGVYPGSVVEVNEVDGEYMVLVKLDFKNVIYTVTASEPGHIRLMGDL